MREFIIKFSDADAEALIKGMPEAKDNELVRCLHCTHFDVSVYGYGYCDVWDNTTEENGFCQKAEADDYTVEPIYSLDQFFNHPIERINDLIEGTKGGIKDADTNT